MVMVFDCSDVGEVWIVDASDAPHVHDSARPRHAGKAGGWSFPG
jgi:hypothetical protein